MKEAATRFLSEFIVHHSAFIIFPLLCYRFFACAKVKDFSMSDNRRSRVITEGLHRSPNRSMMRAVGFGDDDFTKPIIGVANGYSNITPCNLGLNVLAERAIAALHEAGTMPQVFG